MSNFITDMLGLGSSDQRIVNTSEIPEYLRDIVISDMETDSSFKQFMMDFTKKYELLTKAMENQADQALIPEQTQYQLDKLSALSSLTGPERDLALAQLHSAQNLVPDKEAFARGDLANKLAGGAANVDKTRSDIDVNKANIGRLNADTGLTNANAKLVGAQTNTENITGEQKQFTLDTARQLTPELIDMAKLDPEAEAALAGTTAEQQAAIVRAEIERKQGTNFRLGEALQDTNIAAMKNKTGAMNTARRDTKQKNFSNLSEVLKNARLG